MKIAGEHIFKKIGREKVWQLLTDPDVLKRCMPGCEKLKATAENEFALEIHIGVASVKGRYTGKIRMEELTKPAHFKLIVEGKGAPGFLKGSGTFDLTEETGNTKAFYSGDAQVGGTVAAIGQRMLEGVAKMMIGQFFTAVEAEAAALREAERKRQPLKPPKHGLVRDAVKYGWKSIKEKVGGEN